MNQSERRIFLIKALINEDPSYSSLEIPADKELQKRLLRSLFNVRPPRKMSAELLKIQDEYLKTAAEEKGIVDYKSLSPVGNGIYLWRGDITALKCGAIVNAANSAMLGCFVPCHGCIDNAIHTYAGTELRLACSELMKAQGHEEPTGKAKITPAFNLPCDYVIHTVGPIVYGRLTQKEENELISSYTECLRLADEKNIESIAFCCISTGEFRFPPERAAELAIKTVSEYKLETKSEIEVIFNVYKESDWRIYRRLLENTGA